MRNLCKTRTFSGANIQGGEAYQEVLCNLEPAALAPLVASVFVKDYLLRKMVPSGVAPLRGALAFKLPVLTNIDVTLPQCSRTASAEGAAGD